MSGRRVALLLLLAVGLAGCGGASSPRVASVGDREITRAQVDALVQSAGEEVAREGGTLPARGSDGYRQLERQALAILVARARLEQAASRLGIRVDDAELDRWVLQPHADLPELVYEGARRHLGIPEESEKGANAKVMRDAVRVRLTLEKVQRKLGDAGFERWYAKSRRLAVDYADGWAPSAAQGPE